MTSNNNNLQPLDLVEGSAGPFGNGNGGSAGVLGLTANGIDHPVVAGVKFPFNPPEVEFGSDITGVDPSLVVAE